MTLSIELLQFVLLLMLYVILLLIVNLLIHKLSTLDEIFQRNNRRLSYIVQLVSKTFVGTLESLRDLKEIRQTIEIDDDSIIWPLGELDQATKNEASRLNSWNKYTRCSAAVYLGLIGSESARLILEARMKIEPNDAVKMYISNALTDIRNPKSLKVMIPQLIDSKRWYRDKAISNILEFGDAFLERFEVIKDSPLISYKELITAYAAENYNNDLKIYLFDFILRYDEHLKIGHDYYVKHKQYRHLYKIEYFEKDMERLLEKVARTISNLYPEDFANEVFWDHPYKPVKVNAFWAAAKLRNAEAIQMLLNHFHDAEYEKILIACTTKMLEESPNLHSYVEEAFEETLDPEIRMRLATVLANKIEYYILRLGGEYDEVTTQILTAILRYGKLNEWIGFMNLNKNIELENRMIQIMKTAIVPESDGLLTLRTYLRADILEKWGYTPYVLESTREASRREPLLIVFVVLLTLFAVSIYPVIFALTNVELVEEAPFMVILKAFVINFNYLLAYYSITINLSYLILLGFSYKSLIKQTHAWNLKNLNMLFRPKMLPTISIVAPAFNEEKSIIGSTNSLLNLKYPDFEVIIVNDGSSDQTLNTLIRFYKLTRVDYYYSTALKHEPIRGIYRNPSYPKLVVVDKSNGGKADALNAGINIANKEYFCGIDSDSLLEEDALLKLASLTLDSNLETPALGGNVFPLNGGTVDHGHLEKVAIPKHFLAKMQTIEYIRAFMSGRLGWQEINSLLIISGAFGLFRKDRIVSIGGYMTNRSIYKKDTVGEDMELIVRISRLLHEAKQPFRIKYAFNANCWTEVPEDFKSLRTQRIRWHRGLLDILFYHRKMLFNPKYSTTGMISLPYFLIFEAIGPLIEFQGYVMVVLAAFLGILDARIALMLFIATIQFGVIISLASLMIAEHETNYYKVKDLLKIVSFAILENFGPRQVMSFFRIIGIYKIIRNEQGWGQIHRKGL